MSGAVQPTEPTLSTTEHEDAGAVRIPPRVTIVSRRQRKVIGEQG